MAVIYIDNKPYDAEPGKNLLESCLSLGFNLPYFCWHPAMGSVGACRQCAVKLFKDEQDTKGRLVMSCMEMVKDNMYLSIDDPTAKAFRAQIIEWLMTNHPHDCAICDEGGSCHLQDMTVMTGHAYRRYSYKKRTYNNQYLGPFINHEMNRCIQCYRCVRFYKDYAGGDDLDVFAAHNHIYFGRAEDGILENEFSGNLAEVCPTGVFTDKTLKEHYTRKWDMTMAPSVCQHCSLGCNIIAAERYGELRQITSRFNSEVNGYFICDRGRFGYDFVNSPNRIQQPLIRSRIPEATHKTDLLLYLTEFLTGKTIGIGSPRASLESNFALMQLVGKENFYQGISETEAQLLSFILQVSSSDSIHIPSLKEIEQADVVLILGEDITNSAPRMALSLRQTVRKNPLKKAQQINIPAWHDAALRELAQEDKGALFIAYPTQTKLEDISASTLYRAPDDIARLGFAIANALNSTFPLPGNLDEETLNLSRNIAPILQQAENPLIICGTSLYNLAILKAAANIAWALKLPEKKANLSFIVPECNSIGLAMMQAPSLDRATEVLKKESKTNLVILENDLYRRNNLGQIDQIFENCNQVVVLDHLHNPTTAKASVLIPVGTFAESDGTIVNNEGRAQRFFQVFAPKNENLLESWRWLEEIRQFKNEEQTEFTGPDELMAQLVESMPQFRGAENVAPHSQFRIAGQKIPREPHRFSGRTAMLANINVSEPKPPQDPDTPLSFTMEGFPGIPPSPLIPFFWSPGWNSVQAINKYQIEVGGPLHGGDPGKRLFRETAGSSTLNFLNHIPQAFKPAADEWLIIPLPHIFGSEELSIYTNGIAQLSPQPYIAISSVDATSLNIRESEIIQLQIQGLSFQLPAKIRNEMPAGVAGIPYQAEGLTGIGWPATGILTKGVL
ncbi:MAG TPA: NADH-quinone oxidoreductase subunit NuoG [Daejeonella sp.]|nr:NADH-quinone oxidoreductase subunit NuoG [Daejeonella sp.]